MQLTNIALLAVTVSVVLANALSERLAAAIAGLFRRWAHGGTRDEARQSVRRATSTCH